MLETKNLRIAHRGIFDNKIIPENSILAFQKALRLQIPIEFDVRITKDEHVIVFHDHNLKRMCGVDLEVEDLTLKEIKKMKLLSTNENIPTLEEVLTLIDGKVLIDIEIKKTRETNLLCDRVLQSLKDYSGNILLKSFFPNVVKYLKKKSSYMIGLLISDFMHYKLYSYLISSPILIFYCQPDFLAISKKIVKKKRFQKYRKKCPVFVWTLTNLDEFNYYFDYADSFLCNHLPYHY